MAALTDAKTWTLRSTISHDGAEAFLQPDGTPLDLLTVSPVERLLIAVASCYGQTCHNLMLYHSIPISAIELSVLGHKPEGPLVGKGLDQIAIGISFDPDIDERRRSRLTADAERLCTVSNSLSPAIQLTIEIVSDAP